MQQKTQKGHNKIRSKVAKNALKKRKDGKFLLLAAGPRLIEKKTNNITGQ